MIGDQRGFDESKMIRSWLNKCFAKENKRTYIRFLICDVQKKKPINNQLKELQS